jgi:hypothetical protein
MLYYTTKHEMTKASQRFFFFADLNYTDTNVFARVALRTLRGVVNSSALLSIEFNPSTRTVPFHSIRQSRVTDPFKFPKCNGGHGEFGVLPKSPSQADPNIEDFGCLRHFSADILGYVTAVLAFCRNQNFGSTVTGHGACRIE